MLHRLLALALAATCYSKAAAFDTVINIPPATSLAGLQSNTQVNVLDGANLSSLIVPSGLTGVEFNLLGGSIESGLTFGSGTLHIGGGFLESLWNDSDSANQISGGHLRRLYNGGKLDIYGGRIGLLDSDIGEPFRLHGQFFLDGQAVDGPTPIPDGSFLTGVLTDSTPVVFSSTLGDDFRPEGVIIVTAPVPTAMPGVINAPFDPVPYGIRGGKILTLAPGSNTGHDFVAFDSILNVAGARSAMTRLWLAARRYSLQERLADGLPRLMAPWLSSVTG
jgi:hypothetical protein